MNLRVAGPFLLALGIAAPPALGDDAKKDQDKIQGAWDVVEMVAGGNKLPKERVQGMKVVFAKGKMSIVPPSGGEKKEFTFKLDPTKKPKAFDMTPLAGTFKGQATPGTYELEGDTLKLCLSNKPTKDRPKKFASTEGSDLGLMTLKKSTK